MADDITLRHLARQRVRGAPATKPGMSGFVSEYDVSELMRQTQRSLVCPLAGEVTLDGLREAFAKLQAAASAQKLKVTGDPFYVVKADPMVVVPNQREHEACLPVRGEAKEEGDVKPSRLEGGYHILCVTGGGLEDVENVYTWLFGKFLPSRKHEITRPYILHRIATGLTEGEPVVVEVQVPATLSIKPVRVPGSGGEES
ncbi:MAG TPA: GyrI-like domain-containing protein [Polyangiaceae bacterium]|jgi:DNA gyrase inhibitor GyrI|nr:GyrI-like domain-containing protein [Polyangiaceae bacterium]